MFTPMRMLFMVSLGLPVVSWCQPADTAGSARGLFYAETQDTDQLPTPAQLVSQDLPLAAGVAPDGSDAQKLLGTGRRAGRGGRPRPKGKQTGEKPSGGDPATPVDSAANGPQPTGPGTLPNHDTDTTVKPAVYTGAPIQHLGLRYNVLLVDSKNQEEPVDSSQPFRTDECVAWEVEANRTGYLYIFEQGSSGKWLPLFPDQAAPSETSLVRSRKPVRIPSDGCFKMEAPSGVERVFMVLSRNPQDIRNIIESTKNGAAPGAARPKQPSDLPPVHTVSLDNVIADLRNGLKSQDLKLTKVVHPEAQDEKANAVYVVNDGVEPMDRVVTEAQLEHR